jgi:hypothetical protein
MNDQQAKYDRIVSLEGAGMSEEDLDKVKTTHRHMMSTIKDNLKQQKQIQKESVLEKVRKLNIIYIVQSN